MEARGPAGRPAGRCMGTATPEPGSPKGLAPNHRLMGCPATQYLARLGVNTSSRESFRQTQ